MNCIKTEMTALLEEMKLESVVNEVVEVMGGLLHKMYHVTTNKGEYAVKMLNSDIMKRPTALQNTIYSEKIATAFQPSIPVVSALEVNGKQIHNMNWKYSMIFK